MPFSYVVLVTLASLAAVPLVIEAAETYLPSRALFCIRLALRRMYITGPFVLPILLAGCYLPGAPSTSGGTGGGMSADAGDADAGPDAPVDAPADAGACPDGEPGSMAELTPGGCVYYCPMPTPPWGTKYNGCDAHGGNVYVCLPGYSACGADPQTDGCAHPLSSNFDCGACGVECSSPAHCVGSVANGFSCQNG